MPQSVHREGSRGLSLSPPPPLDSRYRGSRRLFYSLPATQNEANLGKSIDANSLRSFENEFRG